MTPPEQPASPPRIIPRSFWLWLAVLACCLVGALYLLWHSHETARELISKSLMTLAGWLATPFVLESSAAITGLIIVLTYNEWKRRADGPDWVEMEVREEAADKPEAPGRQDTAVR